MLVGSWFGGWLGLLSRSQPAQVWAAFPFSTSSGLELPWALVWLSSRTPLHDGDDVSGGVTRGTAKAHAGIRDGWAGGPLRT